jgi:hypothetical protein
MDHAARHPIDGGVSSRWAHSPQFRLMMGYRMAYLGSCCSPGPSVCIHVAVVGRGFLSYPAMAAMAGLP